MNETIDWDGIVGANGVRYIGTAQRQPNGKYVGLAEVNGCLCRVEASVRNEGDRSMTAEGTDTLIYVIMTKYQDEWTCVGATLDDREAQDYAQVVRLKSGGQPTLVEMKSTATLRQNLRDNPLDKLKADRIASLERELAALKGS